MQEFKYLHIKFCSFMILSEIVSHLIFCVLFSVSYMSGFLSCAKKMDIPVDNVTILGHLIGGFLLSLAYSIFVIFLSVVHNVPIMMGSWILFNLLIPKNYLKSVSDAMSYNA